MNNTQIIHFKDNVKRTLFGIVGIKDNEFTHLLLKDGRKVLINRDNVLMIEIFDEGISEEMCKATWGELYKAYSANSTQLSFLKDK